MRRQEHSDLEKAARRAGRKASKAARVQYLVQVALDAAKVNEADHEKEEE
jgi:hypothetical protein